MRAAIVGAEVLTAHGDLRATWEGCVGRAPRPALAPIDRFDASGFGAPRAALLADDDAGVEDDPVQRVLGAHGRVLETCARKAHADVRGPEVPRDEVGLYVATGMVDSALEDLVPAVLASRGAEGRFETSRFFASGFRSIHPLWPLSMLNNVAVGQVAADLDVRGDNLVFACEADAGIRAFQEALAAIDAGAVRLALVAGIAERVSPASLARRALRGVATPPGEGGGVVVLEHPDSARARGVEPWAWLTGAGLAFGEGASARAQSAAVAMAGDGPPATPVPFPDASLLGDLGPGMPAVQVAFVASMMHRLVRPAGRAPFPRALVTGLGSAGAAGALVLERDPDADRRESGEGRRP